MSLCSLVASVYRCLKALLFMHSSLQHYTLQIKWYMIVSVIEVFPGQAQITKHDTVPKTKSLRFGLISSKNIYPELLRIVQMQFCENMFLTMSSHASLVFFLCFHTSDLGLLKKITNCLEGNLSIWSYSLIIPDW